MLLTPGIPKAVAILLGASAILGVVLIGGAAGAAAALTPPYPAGSNVAYRAPAQQSGAGSATCGGWCPGPSATPVSGLIGEDAHGDVPGAGTAGIQGDYAGFKVPWSCVTGCSGPQTVTFQWHFEYYVEDDVVCTGGVASSWILVYNAIINSGGVTLASGTQNLVFVNHTTFSNTSSSVVFKTPYVLGVGGFTVGATYYFESIVEIGAYAHCSAAGGIAFAETDIGAHYANATLTSISIA